MRQNDQLVADALIRAESKAFRAGDEDDLAAASLKSLRKYLLEPWPEEEEEQNDED